MFWNSTSLQQQHHLLTLFKCFGNQIETTTILQTWKNYNQIFADTCHKLDDICTTSNLNKSQEENELKIKREICLHILWNILKYPKHMKYRQINKQALYYYFTNKCHMSGADFDQVVWTMEYHLQDWGFKKGNGDNWYYQYNKIQLLHLWKCYRYWINKQIMYVFILLLIKQMI
ncbi:hypothetical protein RFI_02086 [Reticulomyxa filosa]|uniref:Uncharacterized protein n=1 Tax=Reticulomyxa filosa TaxID=46433 RepID=X6PA29_RETFI|nr:hypothetical protein RFI_02086 [Reticulomyxa filosa]|eukprot:ETO34988.1 hypothetical protein RFI_02086 [Reticulomyxa filosa]